MLEEHFIDDNIKIRTVNSNDYKELFELIDKNRFFLSKWLPFIDYTKLEEDTKLFISKSIQDFEEKKSIQYAIISNDNIVGMFGVNEINKINKSVSFGYWIVEQYQGNGIITNICEYLKKYMILEEKIHRIEIRVDEGNKKSRAIPERLNFNLEGVLKDAGWVDNHYENVCIYSYINLD